MTPGLSILKDGRALVKLCFYYIVLAVINVPISCDEGGQQYSLCQSGPVQGNIVRLTKDNTVFYRKQECNCTAFCKEPLKVHMRIKFSPTVTTCSEQVTLYDGEKGVFGVCSSNGTESTKYTLGFHISNLTLSYVVQNTNTRNITGNYVIVILFSDSNRSDIFVKCKSQVDVFPSNPSSTAKTGQNIHERVMSTSMLETTSPRLKITERTKHEFTSEPEVFAPTESIKTEVISSSLTTETVLYQTTGKGKDIEWSDKRLQPSSTIAPTTHSVIGRAKPSASTKNRKASIVSTTSNLTNIIVSGQSSVSPSVPLSSSPAGSDEDDGEVGEADWMDKKGMLIVMIAVPLAVVVIAAIILIIVCRPKRKPNQTNVTGMGYPVIPEYLNGEQVNRNSVQTEPQCSTSSPVNGSQTMPSPGATVVSWDTTDASDSNSQSGIPEIIYAYPSEPGARPKSYPPVRAKPGENPPSYSDVNRKQNKPKLRILHRRPSSTGSASNILEGPIDPNVVYAKPDKRKRRSKLTSLTDAVGITSQSNT